MKEILFWKSK